MTDFLYNSGKVKIADQTIDYVSDTIKLMLLDSGYAPDQDNDDAYDDISADEISGGGYTAGGETIGGKSITQNNTNNRAEFDANDVTGWNADTWTNARYAVLYKDSGVDSTSFLIALYDLEQDFDAPLEFLFPSGVAFSWGDC